MYPNGETAEGRLDSLSPSAFRYESRTREVTARVAEDSRSRTYQEALDAPSWV